MAREPRSPSRVSRIPRPKRRRGRWSMEFKLAVVKAALEKPEDARIKPTCRDFPGVAPVQVRKWIRLFAPETAAALPPPDESEDEASDVDTSDSSFNYKRSDDSYPSAEQSAAEALMCLPGLMR